MYPKILLFRKHFHTLSQCFISILQFFQLLEFQTCFKIVQSFEKICFFSSIALLNHVLED